jgi:hypothetical protein
MPRIKLGYEVNTGREVFIPDDRHIGITGQTQRSGKTTTLEALISRASGCALAFITKRGEGSFRKARQIPAFFYDPLADKNPRLEPWQFMISVLEAKMNFKMQAAHRRIIIKTCAEHHGKDAASSWQRPRSLSEVVFNVKRARSLATARVESETYMELAAFMDVALPEIQSINPLSDPAKNRLELDSGLNVMDIHGYSAPTQEMVIAACLWDIHKRRKNTKLVIPECQTFLPQKKSGDQPSLVAKIGEEIIRQGAVIRNLLLLDTQDMRGVDKVYIGGCGVFMFGVQREQNEIGRMLKSIPNLDVKINPTQIMLLKKGHFLVQYDDKLFHTYIQPWWLGDEHAKAVALGNVDVESVREVETQKFGSGRTPDAIILDNDSDLPANPPEVEQAGAVMADILEGAAFGLSASDIQELRDRLTAVESENKTLRDENQRLRKGAPATEYGVRTDVRELEAENPGAIHSLEDADAQGAGSNPGLDTTPMTPAPPDPNCPYCTAGNPRVRSAWNPEYFLHTDTPEGQVRCGPRNGHGVQVKTKADPEWHSPPPEFLALLWKYIRAKAFEEQPGILEVFVLRPELQLKIERAVLQVDASTLRGGLALMLTQGFFDAPKNASQAFKELKRLGRRVSTPNVYRELAKLAEDGFFTAEKSGYQRVEGMKITKGG